MMTDPIFSLMEMITPKENTFQDVGYFVSGKVHPKLTEMLDTGGARQKSYPTIGVTHFIAGEDADRDKMDEAKDIFDIPIVSPRWVMYSTHHGKILPASWFLAEGKELFAGLTFTTSGLRGKDLITAWALVTFHNGTFLRHLSKHCTHIIANDTVSRKYAVAKRQNLPVVCVDWLIDTIKNGSRRNETPYDPQFLRSSSSPRPTSASTPLPCTLPGPAGSQPSASAKVKCLDKSLHQITLEPKEIPDWIREANKQKRNSYIHPLQTTASNSNSGDNEMNLEPSTQSDQPPIKCQAEPSSPLKKDERTAVPSTGSNSLTASVIRRPSDNGEIAKIGDNPPCVNAEPTPPPTTRPPASAEQLEIIQIIQNDPQIKLQWAHMDHTQRMLLVQKLAQKNREERLRKEMMLKQQQMQMNHATPPMPTIVQVAMPSAARSMQGPPGGNIAYQNHDLRPRFPQRQMVRQGDGFVQHLRQPILNTEDDGNSTAQQFGHSDTSVSNVSDTHQGQSQHHTIYFTRAPVASTSIQQQRQILVTQHQAGATIRTEHHLTQSFSPPNDSTQRILTPQQLTPQSPNQKVQAYLQNNIAPMQQQHEQQQQMNVSGGLQTQFYGHSISTVTMTSNQQTHGVRRVSLGQPQPQTLVVDPQTSPQAQGQREHFQWSPNSTSSSPGSFNSLSNSPQGQQRLISPTGVMTSRQARPSSDSQPQQQQQWTASMRNQSPQLIFTTQANMPYSQQVMNQKTKTALANLLSNRLMGSTTPDGTPQVSYSMSCGLTGGTTAVPSRSPSPLAPPAPPQISNVNVAPQNRVPTVLAVKQPPQPPHPLQRRTLSNLTNNDKGSLTTNNVIVPMVTPQSPTSSYTTQSARFFGHDPSLKLPAGGFLLGCVFWAAQEVRISHWYKSVTKFGGEVEPTYCARVTHVLCETQKFVEFQQCVRDRKRLVTLFWLNDTIARRCLATPSQAVHLPLPFSENERPYFEESVSTSGFTAEERERVQVMCTLLGLTVTSVFTRANIGLIAKTPEGEKFLKAREWRKPVVNIQFLNELLFGHTGIIPMIHSPKYQQFNMGAPFSFDVALVTPLMAPWKTPLRVGSEAIQKFMNRRYSNVPSPVECFAAAKRLKLELEEMFPPGSPPPSAEGLVATVSSMDEMTLGTESKLVTNASAGVAVILSGFSDGLKDVFRSKIEELGGRVTTDRLLATHLIANDKTVSKSLITFLCIKDSIVGIDWLRYSYAARKFLCVDGYRLKSGVCGIHEINYSAILKMPCRDRLFAGLVFFLTPSVGRDIREMVEAAGGRIVVERFMHKVYESAMKNLESYVIVTCEDDEYLLAGWKGKEGVDNIIIITRDTILGWIVKQDIRKESHSSSSSPNLLDFVQTKVNTASSSADEFPSVLDGIGTKEDGDHLKLEQAQMELA